MTDYAPRHRLDQKIIVPATVSAPANFNIPTQVANPARTSLRTFIQTAIGILLVAVPLLNAVAANLLDTLKQQTFVEVAPWVYIGLNGTLAITAAVAVIITRIMSTPGVADFIVKYLPWLAPIKPIR